jgi:hypothetical protein
MERRREAGSAVKLVLLFVLVIAAAGAWNYRRNVALEEQQAKARPLSGYSTEDLEALAEAYRQEIAAHESRYSAQKSQRAEARNRAYFDQQVKEFEKVQQQAGRVRDAGAEVAVREVDLKRVEEELRARGGVESDLDRHLRLLLTF